VRGSPYALLCSAYRLALLWGKSHILLFEDPSLPPPQALSDAHAFLFEERQRLLTLQAENDELRLQEIEDRKRIQQASRDTSLNRSPVSSCMLALGR